MASAAERHRVFWRCCKAKKRIKSGFDCYKNVFALFVEQVRLMYQIGRLTKQFAQLLWFPLLFGGLYE